MGFICALRSCNNNENRLTDWRKETCKTHGCLQRDCECVQPFKLFPFPKDAGHCRVWESIVANTHLEGVDVRGRPTPGYVWQRKDHHRVCSEHFPNGQPSHQYPHPVLYLDKRRKVSERKKSPKPRNFTFHEYSPSKSPRDIIFHEYSPSKSPRARVRQILPRKCLILKLL